MTLQEALEAVTDAADSWANELEEYIAPASEQYDDEESAEVQRNQAEEIREAITVLYAAITESENTK